jgi:hypothetical protein
VAAQDLGDDARELRRTTSAIPPHHDTSIWCSRDISDQLSREAGRGARDGDLIHPRWTCAELSAQPGSPEGEGACEALSEAMGVALSDEDLQLAPGLGIGIVGDPRLCGCDEICKR